MASKLPPSQLASFHESKQHSIVGSLVLFLVLGNVSVTFRVISQWRTHKNLFAEDYCIVLAVVRYLLFLGRWQRLTPREICSNIVIACYLVGMYVKITIEHAFRLHCLAHPCSGVPCLIFA